jgi:hypothetical protein
MFFIIHYCTIKKDVEVTWWDPRPAGGAVEEGVFVVP